MSLLNRPNAYRKIGIEDPDETRHRHAQFMIYKVLQRADTRRRRSWLGVTMCKLRIKIGKRLKKLRKGFSTTVFSAKSGFCKQIVCAAKSCKNLVCNSKQGRVVRNLPPVF